MNYVTINEKAAAMALDFVVGAEVRVGIERLYELLANATEAAYDEGVEDGQGTDDVEAFSNGYDAGYDQATTERAGGEATEDDEFYEVEDSDDLEPLGNDECQCETCTVERAEASEQDDTLTTPVPLPPMQEQGRVSNPFSWS